MQTHTEKSHVKTQGKTAIGVPGSEASGETDLAGETLNLDF